MRPRSPRSHRSILVPAALAAALAAGSARAGFAQQRRAARDGDYRSRIDTTLAFDKNGTVTVTASNGDVIVTGVSGNTVRIHATSDDDNLRLDASSTRISIEAGNRRGGDTKFEIAVPYGVRVIARSQTGDMSIRNTRGDVEAHAQSGDVLIED